MSAEGESVRVGLEGSTFSQPVDPAVVHFTENRSDPSGSGEALAPQPCPSRVSLESESRPAPGH